MKNIRTLFILFVISALLLSITACNRGNDGVFPSNPQAVGSSGMNSIPPHLRNSFLATAATYLIKNPGFPSGLRANVVSDPRGTNLLLQSRVLFLGGESVVEVDPTAEFWITCINYYGDFLIYLPEVKEINRLFAITNLVTQQVGVWGYKFFEDGHYEYQGVFANGIYGPIIDIERQTPMFANYLVIEIYPPIRPPFLFGVRELGLYGPQPSLKITAPASGSQFLVGETINFTSEAATDSYNFAWSWDGNVFGTSQNVTYSGLPPGTHTIAVTALKTSDNSRVSDSITIEILAGFKIKNLDALADLDQFADNASVSYRAAKTRFQAIGYRADDSEIGPVSVDWRLEGGEVVASEQLRMGILSQLGQNNTRIGNLNASLLAVASATTTTFNSFLPGDIRVTAKKGIASDSVAIRIKQPTFKVSVYPVEGVDVGEIFPTWKTTVEQVWNREDIMKVKSVDLMTSIPNVTFPDYPLNQPPEGAEAFLQPQTHILPAYLNPIYYDYLLGKISSFFVPPRLASLLITKKPLVTVNIYVVRRPWNYWLDESLSPPLTRWFNPDICTVSTRNYYLPIIGAGSLTLWETGSFLKENFRPYPTQYSRYLAAGIGNLFGLPQNAEWLNNLMDFSPIGGLDVAPDQYITALNYRSDNPESSNYILEE